MEVRHGQYETLSEMEELKVSRKAIGCQIVTGDLRELLMRPPETLEVITARDTNDVVFGIVMVEEHLRLLDGVALEGRKSMKEIVF